MAHLMKHTKASCGHMFAHYDRKAEHISNENLDRSRTHLNYNLATHQQEQQGEFIRKRCSEVKCFNRQDVNVMCSWVLTAPKKLPKKDSLLFFQQSYNFMAERYGKENVVSAYVHHDEVSPHMHFAFVPVVEDKKKGGYKVSAKELITRKDLQTFHFDLEQHLNKALGYEVGVMNEATREGNKTVSELKQQTAIRKTKELEEKLEKTEIAVNATESRLESLQGKVMELSELQALRGKKSFTGALKGVTYEEFISLERTAGYAEEYQEKEKIIDEKFSQLTELEKEIKILSEKKSNLYSEVFDFEEKYQEYIKLDELFKKTKKEYDEIKRKRDGLRELLTKPYQYLSVNYETAEKFISKYQNKIPFIYHKKKSEPEIIFKIPTQDLGEFKNALDDIQNINIKNISQGFSR
jgi:archaellum component FlaC